jgi:hypothetical protein
VALQTASAPETRVLGYGYGHLQLNKVLHMRNSSSLPSLDLLVWDNVSISTDEVIQWEVTVQQNSTNQYFKVTICWYDVPSVSSVSTTHSLIHDVDMAVTAPDGTTIWGNGVVGGDSLNPNEQVLVNNASCYNDTYCTYTVQLYGVSITDSPRQKIALIMTTSG